MMDKKKQETPMQRSIRLAKRYERENRGKMEGFSEEFIRPMWTLPKSK